MPLASMQHAFKTPTLRNVARPGLSGEMRPLNLTAGEKNDLVAFIGLHRCT